MLGLFSRRRRRLLRERAAQSSSSGDGAASVSYDFTSVEPVVSHSTPEPAFSGGGSSGDYGSSSCDSGSSGGD